MFCSLLFLFDCHLNDPIQLVFKDAVSFFNILQLVAVGDQRGGVDLSCFDEGENFGAVAAVHTAGFESQIFAVHIRQGKGLSFVIEGHHGDNGIGPGAFPGQAEGILGTCHFQHHIGAAVVRVGSRECLAVFRFAGQHIGVMLMDEGNSSRVFFADDDSLRLSKKDAHEGAQTRGACADDEDGVFLGDFGNPGGPEAGGQHIAHQKSLLVGDGIGDFVQTLIRIRATFVSHKVMLVRQFNFAIANITVTGITKFTDELTVENNCYKNDDSDTELLQNETHLNKNNAKYYKNREKLNFY